jgi:queuine tRNA-ribosyltransferase
MISFACAACSGAARAGQLVTRRGVVNTPAFMPVATQAAVKALTVHEVAGTGARVVIMNTYHLWLRPGTEVVRAHGGLHEFCKWPHVIVTDSGGYQAYSLAARTQLSEDGFVFSSHLDGTRLHLSPEQSMRVQGLLDSDIAMQLDVCPPADASSEQLLHAVEQTTRWAERSLAARTPGQALFGIVQGGIDVRVRLKHAETLARLPLDGLALGGLSVGEPREQMHSTLREVAPQLDPARPRYLMGVGTPADLVRAIGCGIDLFDCVLPTRNARNGQAFISSGRINVRNARFEADTGPLDRDCDCPVCAGGYSRSYLRHLYMAGEILAHRLLTLHNVHLYQRLVRDAREAVLQGDYSAWARAELAKLEAEGG